MEFYEILHADEKLRYLVVLIFTFYICQHIDYEQLDSDELTYGDHIDGVKALLKLSDVNSS